MIMSEKSYIETLKLYEKKLKEYMTEEEYIQFSENVAKLVFFSEMNECSDEDFKKCVFEHWDEITASVPTKSMKGRRVPYNEMFSWDEWCPEYYCSECESKIANNEEQADIVMKCPYCGVVFE